MKLAYLWAKMLKKARLSAVSNSRIHSSSRIGSGSLVVDSTFDRHSFCGYDCEIASCDVGSFSSIASRVAIGGGRHPLEWVGTSPAFYSGRQSIKAKFSTHDRDPIARTRVGHDVWIGYGAMVAQGVTIGDGAVVGMGSIVTRDVPDYTIVAGNPARPIRSRFDEDVVEALRRILWWEFSDEKLEACAEYFPDPRVFIEKLSSS
jgi:acetyltransferase-like isoleucine patch superfamily enzyme